jgi:hypothetical protein
MVSGLTAPALDRSGVLAEVQLRGGREIVAPTAPNWTSATWTAPRPRSLDADGDRTGLGRDVGRHVQPDASQRALGPGLRCSVVMSIHPRLIPGW